MASRMDRYSRETKRPVHEVSRTDKYQKLYQEPEAEPMRYHDLQDLTQENVAELGALQRNHQTRESYQRLKEYQDVLEVPKSKRELEEFSSLYKDENKIYDINSVLVEAKKNRLDEDELERKRKLRNKEYNILESVNLKDLEKYRKEKQNRLKEQAIDEEELTNLIDTITSNSMSKELMSDLLPTKEDETVITRPLSQEDIAKAEKNENVVIDTTKDQSELKDLDQSFYTDSMELSLKDFGEEDEFAEDIKPNKMQSFFKVLLTILLIGVVGFVIYFIITNI